MIIDEDDITGWSPIDEDWLQEIYENEQFAQDGYLDNLESGENFE